MNVKSGHTISWSIQPHKKSINFGIFQHPGSGIAPTPKPPISTFEVPPTPGVRPADGAHDTSQAQTTPSAAIEKLKGIGLKLVLWYGTCDANQVTSGKYDVPEKEGGMYALVFDNTFAKQFSKTATFVLLTYPTDSAPQSNHQVHHFQTTSSSSLRNLKTRSRSRRKLESPDSSESIPRSDQSLEQTDSLTVPKTHKPELSESSTSSNFYTGILQKRRRKRHQGYARRFFSLDFTSSTLSYYHNRNTLALRGAVPLSLAAIGANGATREISIDSGAEVWHLRAPNRKEFEAWKNALESASRVSANRASLQPGGGPEALKRRQPGLRINVDDEREWVKAESLVERVAATREIARRLARDTDPKYLPLGTPNSILGSSLDMNRVEPSSGEASPIENAAIDEFPQNGERRSFWKRKASGGRPSPGLFSKRSVSAQPTISSPRSLSNSTERVSVPFPRQSQFLRSFPQDGLHEQCMSMLEELDAVVADFKTLIAESRQRRAPMSPLSPAADLATSRMSLDSQGTDEFFDAEGGDGSQILNIQPESDDEAEPTDRDSHTYEHDVSSTSEIEDDDSSERSTVAGGATLSTFPLKAKNLMPLPLPPIQRRKTVPCPTVSPPSLIGFLRKNVGKDLSTISMPVSANEPISLLQKVAEQMEYSTLLDEASKDSLTSIDRLLHIAAFATSSYSALRVKERGLRKPFNPMLGETFELVREDRNFRFLAEKISHRPVRLAYQAESDKWSLAQSPLPTQKFWGKSAELITEGRTRVILHGTGNRFSWTPATCFLRNIIAGEKYIEPVGSMTITNEASGEHAIVTFKVKGIFSGRSEDVVVQTFDAAGAELPLGLAGKWTSSLCATENGVPLPRGRPLWTVGDLVPDAPKRYGFTAFTASLNELLPGDGGAIAPTDSRFRPDQRAAEEGDVDAAEGFKAKLEDGQRERRRVVDEEGGEWTPMWFSKVEGAEGEEVWSLRGGREGYWERRGRGDWRGCVDVLGV